MAKDNLKELEKKKASVKSSEIKKEELKSVPAKVVPPAKSKKQLREERRDERASNLVNSEAGEYSIDINTISKAPLTTSTEENITNSVKQLVGKEFASDIDNFANAYSNPQYEDLPELDLKRLKESARKQRRVRWADALYAFGQGLQGRVANPETYASTRLQRERDQQYQNYKNTVDRNRKIKQAYEDSYRNDLMDWIQQKIDDTTLSAAEREKYKVMADQIAATNRKTALGEKELASRINNSYYDSKPNNSSKTNPVYTEQLENGGWKLTNQDNPYSDLYYKLAGNSPVLVNELAKIAGYAVDDEGALKRNLSSDETERFANTLLSRMYDFSTDEKGVRMATPKPGMENYLNDLSGQMQAVRDLENELMQIENEYNTEYSSAKKRNRDDVDEKYNPLREEKRNEIQQAQKDLKNLLEGKPLTRSTFSDIVKAHQ
ncbi:hypothetical protein [Draconibacterium sp.]|uniref:hypothetical protein n=1 Tax=Draconibacterium sp. TaxID=1965318 RepID=UPI003561729C